MTNSGEHQNGAWIIGLDDFASKRFPYPFDNNYSGCRFFLSRSFALKPIVLSLLERYI